MERIVIEVPKGTAKKWRESPLPKRKKITALINKVLNENKSPVVEEPKIGYARPSQKESEKHFKSVQKHLPTYKSFLESIRKKAESNGLTEEILTTILKKKNA
jgi:hypothetical protein